MRLLRALLFVPAVLADWLLVAPVLGAPDCPCAAAMDAARSTGESPA